MRIVFGIGSFARLGQVSVRTLHHYDEVGLLTPAEVDGRTGYRWYRAEQLHRLNRIIALRDLGFPLQEIRVIVDETVTIEELRGMLRLRRAEAIERRDAENERLRLVEARLRQIESEDRASDYDIVVKRLEPLRVVTRQANIATFGAPIGPVLGRLRLEVQDELTDNGIDVTGPWLALYEDSGDDLVPITVIAAVPIDFDAVVPGSLVARELPDVSKAATTIHRGTMACIDDGYQALLRWTETTGERVVGYSREVYHDCTGDQEAWLTELQFTLQQLSG